MDRTKNINLVVNDIQDIMYSLDDKEQVLFCISSILETVVDSDFAIEVLNKDSFLNDCP